MFVYLRKFAKISVKTYRAEVEKSADEILFVGNYLERKLSVATMLTTYRLSKKTYEQNHGINSADIIHFALKEKCKRPPPPKKNIYK